MNMGLTYANIELVNGDDFTDTRRGRIGEDEVRQLTVHTMVDRGSIMLCIFGWNLIYALKNLAELSI